MSRLENEARRILSPFILGGERFIKLSRADLQLLAAWVIKSWMAYSLTRSEIENPFYRVRLPRDRSDVYPAATV